MAQRKLRLEVQQSNERGECGNPRVPRWYGQHSITTGDITGSVMKILITDSKGEQISITIGNNGSIQGVNKNRENKEDHLMCTSPNDLQIEGRMNTNRDTLSHIVNNQQSTREIPNSNLLSVKEELKEYEEPTTGSSVSFEEVIGVISEGYKLEPLETEVEEEFHTEMEGIKSEEPDLAGQYETVYMDSEILLPENDKTPRAEQSSQISGPMIQSTNDITLLCRLCATERKDMIYIFIPNEAYKTITEKIQDCLPILVRKTDTLPKQICRLCLEKLEMFHKFYKTVAEAEKQLNILSKKISEELKIAEEVNETLPLHNGQLDNEKLSEELVSDKKPPTNYKLCSLPVTPKSPQLLNSREKVADNNNTDDNIIFMGETAIVDDLEEEFDIIKCRICGLFFGTAKSCYTHALIHNSEDYFPCSMCDQICTNTADSYKHGMQHVAQRQIQKMAPKYKKKLSSCNLQSTAITDKNNADVKDQTPVVEIVDDMIKCRICRRYFGSAKSCYTHSIDHASKDYWPCSMCDKILPNATDSWKHSEKHIVPKVPCQRAAIIAKSLSDINQRSPPVTRSRRLSNNTEVIAGRDKTDDNITAGQETVENQASIAKSNSNDTVKCRICDATFFDTRSCYSHAKVHVEEDYYPCTMCHKTFTTTRESWRHALDHIKDRNDERKSSVYMCNTCGRKFVREDRLRFHEIYHNPNIRPCYCEQCDKLLSSESSLYRHMLNIHNRSKKYTCEICREQLSDQLQLDFHRLKHANERFECSLCNSSFLSNDELKLHRQQHGHHSTSATNSSCFYCGQTFLQKCSLTDHIKKHTNECPYIFSRPYVNNESGNKDDKTPTDGEIVNFTEPEGEKSLHTRKRPSDYALSSESFQAKKTKTEHTPSVHTHDK